MAPPLSYLASLGASAYCLSVGIWRYMTYEARGVGNELYPVVCLLLTIVDVSVVFETWKRFIAGKMFRYVDMDTKVCIVTGANTGIGRETARFLAEMGANVILACRNESKALEAINCILKTSGKRVARGQLEFMRLDVSSISSVQEFVEAFKGRGDACRLDVLINNAGVMLNDRVVTREGLECTMATNHYGHFHLTNLLLPLLEKSPDGRVVNVSSSLHKVPRAFNVDDPLFEKGYSLFGAYGQSKLANVIFTVELQRRLTARKSSVTCHAVHPGNVQTEVTRNMPFLLYWGQRLFKPVFLLYQKTAPIGAYTSVHVATAPQLRLQGGGYYVNCERTNDVSAIAYDPAVGKQLWEMSERACQAALSKRDGVTHHQ